MHENLEYLSTIQSYQESNYSFHNLPSGSYNSHQEENYPTFIFPDHLSKQRKSNTNRILQEPIPDCIASKQSKEPSHYLNIFENPLFPEVKSKIFHIDPSQIQVQFPHNPLVALQPTMDQPPPTRMELIVAAAYAPLVLPDPLDALPQGDYLKYLPKYTR